MENFEESSHVIKMLITENNLLYKIPDQGNHILYTLNEEQVQDLTNPKKWLGNSAIKTEITTCVFSDYVKNDKVSVLLQNSLYAFNNIVLKFKINTNEKKVQIGKIFNWIKLEIGGHVIDEILGSSIEVLLKIHNLSYTDNDGFIMLPIPFGVTLSDNVIMKKLIPCFDCRLNIGFGSEYKISRNSLEVLISNYTPTDYKPTDVTKVLSHNKELNEKSNKKLLNLIEQYYYKTFDSNEIIKIDGKIKLDLFFKFPIIDMIFYCVDKFGNVVKERLFDFYFLNINGMKMYSDKSYDDTISVSKDLPNGYYRINIKNLFGSHYDCKYNKEITNFSSVDTASVTIKPTNNFDNKEYSIVVMSISLNVLQYSPVSEIMFYPLMYSN